MKYSFYCGEESKDNDQFVIESSQNSLFQCSQWAEVKNNWNHVYARATDENGKVVATALILIRSLAFGKKLFYIPRGPVMDYKNAELVTFFINELKKYAKSHKAAVLRFDPKVHSRFYAFKDVDTAEKKNEDVIDLLKKCGAQWKGYTTYIEEATQPRFNAEYDINENFRSLFTSKTNRSIKKAERSGVKIYTGIEHIDEFCEAMHYTEVRKQIALRSKAYFETLLKTYPGQSEIYVAKVNLKEMVDQLETNEVRIREELTSEELSRKRKTQLTSELQNITQELQKLREERAKESKDEIVLSGGLAVWNKNLFEMLYMGNNPDYMRYRSSYAISDLAFKYCEEHGIREFSFGGVEGTLDDGLTVFKSNFPMNVEEYIGEFNIVFDGFVYHLFENVYPWLLKTAAKMKGKKK